MRLNFFLCRPAMILSGKLVPMSIDVNIGKRAIKPKAIAWNKKIISPLNQAKQGKKTMKYCQDQLNDANDRNSISRNLIIAIFQLA